MEDMQTLCVSFSGGRTSAYMTKKILDNWSDRFNIIVCFANTGLENNKTLEFIHKCDKEFGFNTVWLESKVHHGERKGSTHTVVSYETADRSGRVFEEFIKKYGIPNTAFLGCTRELKKNPIDSYMRSLGLTPTKTKLAIGIRVDELRRVNRETASRRNILYPLIDEWATDKEEILEWWKQQTFDLNLDEFEGNCKGCYKKSFNKLFAQIDRDPTVFEFHKRMETLYSGVGPQKGKRVFFRGNRSVEDLFKLHQFTKDMGEVHQRVNHEGGVCSESCEML